MKRIFKTAGAAMIAALSALIPAQAMADAPSFFRAPQGLDGAGAAQKPNARRDNVIHRSIAKPRGNVYAVSPTSAGAVSFNDAFYGKINLANGVVERIYTNPVFTISESDYNFQTGAVRGDILYIPAFSVDMVTGQYTYNWRRVNIKTGEVLTPVNFPLSGACYALAYCEADDRFYAFCSDSSQTVWSNLVRVNPADMSVEELGNYSFGEYMAGIAYYPANKKLYAFNSTGLVYEIDPANPSRMSPVKEFDTFSEFQAKPDSYQAYPVVYSPLDDAFVTIYRDSSRQQMELIYMDPETFDVTEGEYLNVVAYISSMYSPDPYASRDAAGLVTVADTKLNHQALSGTISATAPTELFCEKPIAAGTKMTARLFIDGKEAWTKSVTPGEKFEAPFSTTEGMHLVTVRCDLSDALPGPETQLNVYVGKDAPFAPENVVFGNYTVTWKTPAEGGANGGLVNTSEVTYNVYVDGKKVNTQPISGLSYKIEKPAHQQRVTIYVTAAYEGNESVPSKEVSVVIGDAEKLPVSYAPTAEEFSRFQVADANADGKTFTFQEGPVNANDPDAGFVRLRGSVYSDRHDDWLFLPLSVFNDGKLMYEFGMDIRSEFNSDATKNKNNVIIYIGKEATPAGMTQEIARRENYNPQQYEILNTIFAVPAAGEYYVGIHVLPYGDVLQWRGTRMKNFYIKQRTEDASGLPANPTDLKVVTEPNGKTAGVITFKYPTENLIGGKLDAATDITVTATCGDFKAQVTGKPGAEDFLTVEAPEPGFHNFTVTASTATGEGMKQVINKYVGLDTPLPPTNVKGVPSADNRSMILTWDAPTEGVNGGYIDPAGLTYTIQARAGGSSYTRVGSTDKTTYTYTPANSSMQAIDLGPVATNEIGQSMGNVFIYDIIGEPIVMPMVEEWPTGFTYGSVWKQSTTGQFSNCDWSPVTNLNDLGYGDPVFEQQGGMICSNVSDSGMDGQGELIAPKVSTKGIASSTFTLRYWDYANAGNIEIWGRRHGQETLELLHTFVPDHDLNGKWVDGEMVLPEGYNDCSWIQLNVRPRIAAQSAAIFDSYKVVGNLDHDLRVTGISGKKQVLTGEEHQYLVTAVNAGLEPANGKLKVELLTDGKSADSFEVETGRLAPTAVFQQYVTFTMKPEYLNAKTVEIKATTILDGDEIPGNDSMSYALVLLQNPMPAMTQLKGEREGQDVNLAWTEVTDIHEYGNFEGFEYLPSFTISEFNNWKVYDGDGKVQFGIQNLDLPNVSEPSAWQVIDAAELGITNDPRIAPHSGTKYIMARSVAYNQEGGEEPTQNADWLISPEVVGGTRLTFWLNTIDPTYPETVELWESSTDDTFGPIEQKNGGYTAGSFTRTRPFTKSGDESWEECSVTLKPTTKYFALVYRSWGAFAALIDDIEFTPVKLNSWTFDSYGVWASYTGKEADFKMIDSVKGLAYRDNNNGGAESLYYVTARMANKTGVYDSPRSNIVSIATTGVEESVTALEGIIGGQGEIIASGYAGKTLSVYAADGKHLMQFAPASDHASVSVEPGIYVVVCGKKAAKIMVR